MPFVSITRLRLRSVRFLPLFVWHTTRARRQLRQAGGFQAGALLGDRKHTFWTATVCDSQEQMRKYMASGAHRTVMPRLLDWCDEASVVHWPQAGDGLPSWEEADRRMRGEGRPSKVRHPSREHAGLAYASPRMSTGLRIDPARG